MGAATSTGLVDSVLDGDIQQLKAILHSYEEDDYSSKDKELELEEAVHTVVASELESGQHLQQLQIALELLLHTRPEAWSSTVSSQESGNNSAMWSACHRACATGNLAFVAFALQQYPDQFAIQKRDVFGLFPIDLVPPELLMTAEEIDDNLREVPDRLKPGTARTRRCLALQNLRERKAKLQGEQIRSFLGDSKLEEIIEETNQEEKDDLGEFYVVFEPRRDHLSVDQECNMGHVHERGALLRVNYRLPRAEPFLNGYFQLIWRELGDPRSEEPNYDPSITKLRDENAQILDQDAALQPQQLLQAQDNQEDPVETKESSPPRSLEYPESNSVVEGCFSVDVTHLPADSVCNMLFITCDRRMLHRTIALSTESLAVQIADISDADSDDYFSDSTSYTFFVGGEEFSHPNSVFAGQSFPDVEAFENFLRDLRVKKQRRLQEKQEKLDQLEQERKHGTVQFQQQQEAGQEAEEFAGKTDGAETSATQLEEETRPVETPSKVKPQQTESNQDDHGSGD
eukprot:jgi/Phyca11/550347/estExt2_Genewise1Plus.C_PHYCAscaffold_360425